MGHIVDIQLLLLGVLACCHHNLGAVIGDAKANQVQALGRLESLVAGLVKKTDALETLVETQAEELHSTSVAALAKRVDKLEITKVTQVLESCEQVAQTGITEPGFFPLDFDGKGFGLPTINVYCDLPSVTTVIGKEVSFDIQKCNTAGCFEKLITYDNAPMPQIAALLNSASECSQSLTLNCFMAPISFMTQDYLSWRDRHGNYHPVQNLGDNNCNWKKPMWEKDVGAIQDLSLLPITGIKYGPLIFDIEQANVTVGPLNCQPGLKDEFNLTAHLETIDNRIGSLEELNLDNFTANVEQRLADLENKTEEFFKKPKCPDRPFFTEVEGTCFYIETRPNSYSSAKANCMGVFPGGLGRLYEPSSVSQNNAVHQAAKRVTGCGSYYYICLDQIGRSSVKSSYYYCSTGAYPSGIIDSLDNGSLDDEDCVGIDSNGKWEDIGCGGSQYSICEMTG